MSEPVIDTSAANADVVDVATLEGPATPEEGLETNQDVTTGEDDPSPTEPAPPAEPPQPEITETQAFAKRLAEKTAEAERAATERFNELVAKLGGTLPDGSPIQTVDDLQRALELQELQAQAEQQNVPVEVLSRLTQAERDALEAKTMLSQYQHREAVAKEAESLANDPAWGEFYKANEADIHKVANQAGIDLATAKLIVYDRVGPQKVDEEAIANKAIQEYLAGRRVPKPVEGSGAAPVPVVQTPKTFAEARDGARAILRSMKE